VNGAFSHDLRVDLMSSLRRAYHVALLGKEKEAAAGWLSSLWLYSIVLYLYIYIALLAVHTNQKRF